MSTDRKLYLGPRLRMLRRELGLNQTQMAEELGVSPSYLNHLERNQRPLTAQMLLRLAETYDLDVRGFVAGANDTAVGDLNEVFADDLVREIGVGRQEVLDVAENYPGVADAVVRLYRALADLRQLPERVEQVGGPDMRVSSPIAWLRDWLEAKRNHFGDIDAAAEALSAELGEGPEAVRDGAVARLADRHGIGVRVVAQDLLVDAVRHYDYHRRRLLLSERLAPSGRLFAIAVQLAQAELSEALVAAVNAAAPPDAECRALAVAAITNYAAAAIIMPYARFLAAAEASGYDLHLLADRFGTSWVQCAHRLTTLDRAAARGVPLFLIELDAAGNVGKRVAADAAPLARFGGGCPRWRVHRAFRRPGEVVADLVEMPDGTRYLTWGQVTAPAPGREPRLIVLGCDAAHADRIALTTGAPTPIGPACHLCERAECTDRSLPPIVRALDLSPSRRTRARYPFRQI